MFPLIRAELRAARSSWLAVLVSFVATSFAIVLALLVMGSMNTSVAAGVIPERHAPAAQFVPAWNLALAVIGTLSVIAAVTGLVVQSRRGALARLSLAGATPRQLSRLLIAQIAIVAVVGALFGVLLAIVAQPGSIQMLLGDRGVDASAAIVRTDPLLITVGAVGFVLVCVVAGLRQARVAAAVAPVEALRTIPGAEPRIRRAARWVGAALLTLAVVGIAAGVTLMAPMLGTEGVDTVLQGAVLCILLVGAALSLAGPLTIGALTRAWTAIIPVRSASWVLARAAVVAKGERLARTVTPIMLSIGLLVGLGTIVATTVALLETLGRPSIGNTTLTSLLVLIALVLIVSVSGGISVVLMMSRQREAELALAGVVGASPRQQVMVTVWEGVIITVTATVLALVMTAVGVVVFLVGLSAVGLDARVVVPWGDLAAVVGVCVVAVTAATTLPVLPSLRRPSRQVAAQLAAE